MKSISVYIHYPFCISLCPYCDFNSFVKDATNEEDIIEGYIAELSYYKKNITQSRVKSIYFGGGTPSLMKPQSINKIIKYIQNNFEIEKNPEITLEANPSTIENKKLQNFRQAGINRISIGIQALNDKDLRFLGRSHNTQNAIEAIKIAQDVFDEYTFDLIYARNQEQTPQAWQEELEYALSLTKNHISLYNLTIEKGTPFFTQNIKGALPRPTPEQAEEIYFSTIEIMKKHGFKRYEISNFCKNNKYSKHNMMYWQIQDYLGIGPGAHGRVFYKNNQRMQTMTYHNPAKWLRSIGEKVNLQIEKSITQKEQIVEIIMMGLRILDGIDVVEIKQRLGINIQDYISQEVLSQLTTHKLIEINNNYIKPTEQGINLNSYIIQKLVTGIL